MAKRRGIALPRDEQSGKQESIGRKSATKTKL
jgi:hypothetical protein